MLFYLLPDFHVSQIHPRNVLPYREKMGWMLLAWAKRVSIRARHRSNSLGESAREDGHGTDGGEGTDVGWEVRSPREGGWAA